MCLLPVRDKADIFMDTATCCTCISSVQRACSNIGYLVSVADVKATVQANVVLSLALEAGLSA